ncbi:MAG: ABC transporter ATP-binding protein [Caldilineaceae bacterium]|nr:ABC transporter ATP-binding protein [Caldilineaceae bacterium]HRJ41573.1 ABC transporter ATP-binding protein [Caldilineaceae bacterium]
MSAILELRNVSKIFGGGLFSKNSTVAVEDVSFSIPSDNPTMIAVAGESGSGKTTLSRLLLGVARPSKGQVLYSGADLATLSKEGRKQFLRDVQPIYQDPFGVYNPFYKADHLLYVAIKKFRLASTSREMKQLIVEALETVGMRADEVLGRYPHQLSGGQRQRMMVARALLLRPKVILADEPVSMVDASLRATILESLRSLNRDFDISILYVTHDLTTAYQICESILIMYRGAVVEAGSVEEVIRKPKHPYTQLLVESIPQMRAVRNWEQDEEGETMLSLDESRASAGCKFADRCPQVMDKCWTDQPPLYQTDSSRVARCFLYEDAPVLEGADVTSMLIKSSA